MTFTIGQTNKNETAKKLTKRKKIHVLDPKTKRIAGLYLVN